MKLAVVCQSYPSPGNQVYVFVEQLVNAMVDQGVGITVIAPQSITNCIMWHKPLLPAKCTVKTSKGNSYNVLRPKFVSFGNCKGLLEKIAYKWKKQRIMSCLKKASCDVVYTHFWEFADFVSEYCRSKRLPLFVACGEGDDALEILISTHTDEYIRLLKESVTGVISVSSENKRKCISYKLADGKNIIVLPNCVDTSIFRPKKVESLKKELGISESDFVISYVGSFIERKGSGRLAAAITTLGVPSIKSIFIGNSLSGDCVIPECDGILHCGPLEHSLIPDYLNCSDVFVLPTRKEGCSNAIVEALACGLPVISSNGAFNDDILNDENSIRIDPDDIQAIADAILQMRRNADIKKKFIEQMTAHNPYSIENRATKIINFIKSKI